MTKTIAGRVTAVIGSISEALGELVDDLGGRSPAEVVRHHAALADQLAAITEGVVAAEVARGGDQATIRRLQGVAIQLGVQNGQLDELASRLERGEPG